MRILGIDPGLRHLGYGIIDYNGNQFKFVKTGTISPNTKIEFADKLYFLSTEIEALIIEFKPNVMSIEEAFYGKNANTALKMGHVRGAAMIAGKRNNLAIGEYAARKIKSSITGNGAADKEQVRFMVQRLLNLKEKISSLDASDALAIAICHAFNSKWK